MILGGGEAFNKGWTFNQDHRVRTFMSGLDTARASCPQGSQTLRNTSALVSPCLLATFNMSCHHLPCYVQHEDFRYDWVIALNCLFEKTPTGVDLASFWFQTMDIKLSHLDLQGLYNRDKQTSFHIINSGSEIRLMQQKTGKAST